MPELANHLRPQRNNEQTEAAREAHLTGMRLTATGMMTGMEGKSQTASIREESVRTLTAV
jgi:hypothetical protein